MAVKMADLRAKHEADTRAREIVTSRRHGPVRSRKLTESAQSSENLVPNAYTPWVDPASWRQLRWLHGKAVK